MTHSALNGDALAGLLSFIPLFEQGLFREASSQYVSTGHYSPPAEELLEKLRSAGLAEENFDWMGWIEQARPYLQAPESIGSASLDQVAKLVALATTADRFNKSLFPHLCSSGVLYHLLLRIRALCP